MILLVPVSQSIGGPVIPKTIVLTLNHVNLMLVGDEAVVRTGPLNKNIKSVRCVVWGKVISPVGRAGAPSSGYTFTFRAVKSGKAIVMEKIKKFGKKGEAIEFKKFGIRVYTPAAVPLLSLKEIAQNPGKYARGFVLIAGTSRGWGRPAKAQKIWGTMATRSDWVIEDTTGAAYISGILKVEKGRAVRIICRVLVRPNGSWTLIGHRILPDTHKIKGLKGFEQGNNRFAWFLYKRPPRTKGNLFSSSFSVSLALA